MSLWDRGAVTCISCWSGLPTRCHSVAAQEAAQYCWCELQGKVLASQDPCGEGMSLLLGDWKHTLL